MGHGSTVSFLEKKKHVSAVRILRASKIVFLLCGAKLKHPYGCLILLLQQEGLISILSDKEYMHNTWRNLCYLKELLKAGEVQKVA